MELRISYFFAPKHRLWVLIRTASPRCKNTIYATNKKKYQILSIGKLITTNKIEDFFFFCSKNIDCGYSLEPACRGYNVLNTIYVLKYEKISNSLDRKADHYLQTFNKNRVMCFCFLTKCLITLDYLIKC